MNNSTKKISIILPTYNGEQYLAKAIDSCLKQTYQNLELIIVDDCSTDQTPNIIASFKDERIKYFRQEQNVGIVKNLNKGFSLSTGEYLTWTSDDNYYELKAMEVMAKVLEQEVKIDFVYAPYYVVNAQNCVLRSGRIKSPVELDEDNCIGGCFLYRRKVYETIGDFNSEAFLVEDYEYWLRVRQKFTMKMLNENLYYYRLHQKSLTSEHGVSRIQAQVEKFRDQYIPGWKKCYFHAKKNLQQNERGKGRGTIIKSLILNPFFYESWRLAGLLFLSEGFVKRIQSLKNKSES